MNEKFYNPVKQELGHFIRPSAVSIRIMDNEGKRMDATFTKVIELVPVKDFPQYNNVEGLLSYLKENGWVLTGFTTKIKQ